MAHSEKLLDIIVHVAVKSLCAFLCKSVKHTFSSRKMYPVEKRCFHFSCCFNVMVTSQRDVPIFDLCRA